MLTAAYFQSDVFGKVIFLLLLFLSIVSWSVICYKVLQLFYLKKIKKEFEEFLAGKKSLLLQTDISAHRQQAYFDIFFAIQTKTKDLLKKNSTLGNEQTFLSKADLDSILELKESSIHFFSKQLEKNLYLLSLVVTLAPFLGLLGTVWGILVSFFEMQGASNMRDVVLSGLATALTTTVLGLIVAIPALIGFSVLKNKTRETNLTMQRLFSQFIGILELQYRSIT